MEFLPYVYHILFIMKLSETCPNFDHPQMFAVTQTIRNMSMLTRSIEGKVKELYTFGRQHVRLWSRALGTAERGATPTGIVLEPATKDR